MTQVTVAARAQLVATAAFYLAPNRSWIGAAENLERAFEEALEDIGAEPTNGVPHPPRYPCLAAYGFLWRLFGIYWFAFVPEGPQGEPVITNIINRKNLDGEISVDENPDP